MSNPKKKKYRSLRVTPRPEKKEIATTELVLTLSVADGEILKVEMLDKSGNRRPMSEEEFAALAGEEGEDQIPLEDAYVAGFSDASDDVFDFGDGDDAEEDEIERFILREMTGGRTLRHDVRRAVLRRLLGRDLSRGQGPATSKARHESTRPAAHKNGHEGSKEGG